MSNYHLTQIEQVERLRKLADVIDEHPDQFLMSWWVAIPDDSATFGRHQLDNMSQLEEFGIDLLTPGCNTRACVAGWTACLWGGELPIHPGQDMKIEDAASHLLGLHPVTRDHLFDCDARHQHAEDAVRVIRDLADYIVDNDGDDGLFF